MRSLLTRVRSRVEAPAPARGAARPDGGTQARRPGARQRLFQALRAGGTLQAAAVAADVPLALAEVMVDEMRRTGLLDDASSFCASGLGACHAAPDELTAEAQVHCAGCPLTIRAPRA